ncbi:MAG: hypothetical protein AVDCRST_MAG73-311 [uncultured Thermomicrobiales bacterium]|uniref:Uncharacterized protein n=1 Tax=uncultured Thermomicrobiales bacterium TaxID=1645740 RepID=A0A6J4TH92_9BACT|nr:MAG: hypothetical protein AVDCRST_MAG73-311 [uncultured Thermomicrobiales bacterium]
MGRDSPRRLPGRKATISRTVVRETPRRGGIEGAMNRAPRASSEAAALPGHGERSEAPLAMTPKRVG